VMTSNATPASTSFLPKWSTEKHRALQDQRVHERRVLLKALLCPARTVRVPCRALTQCDEVARHEPMIRRCTDEDLLTTDSGVCLIGIRRGAAGRHGIVSQRNDLRAFDDDACGRC
jgi:hypothetical protein